MMPWQGDGGIKPFKLQTNPMGKAASGRPKKQPQLLKVNDQATSGFDFGMDFDGSSLTQDVNDAVSSKKMPVGLARKGFKQKVTPKVMETGATGRRANISRGFSSNIAKGRT